MTLGIFKVKGANLNDACYEDIQTLRQELNILRQQLKLQEEEIKKLREVLPRKTNHRRDAFKREVLSSKASRGQFASFLAPRSFKRDQLLTEIKSLRTDIRVPHNVTIRQKRKFTRQGTILIPLLSHNDCTELAMIRNDSIFLNHFFKKKCKSTMLVLNNSEYRFVSFLQSLEQCLS